MHNNFAASYRRDHITHIAGHLYNVTLDTHKFHSIAYMQFEQ